MSASDKLKALQAQVTKRGYPDNDLDGEDLLLALPQIIAVMEAAERTANHLFDEDDGEALLRYVKESLGVLAALDEALS